jgi:hypothetical protein
VKQSRTRSFIETGAATLITGSVAAAMNYWLLPAAWTLPPTIQASLEMSLVYGGVSWVLKYLIRRLFNGCP